MAIGGPGTAWHEAELARARRSALSACAQTIKGAVGPRAHEELPEALELVLSSGQNPFVVVLPFLSDASRRPLLQPQIPDLDTHMHPELDSAFSPKPALTPGFESQEPSLLLPSPSDRPLLPI